MNVYHCRVNMEGSVLTAMQISPVAAPMAGKGRHVQIHTTIVMTPHATTKDSVTVLWIHFTAGSIHFKYIFHLFTSSEVYYTHSRP